MSPGVGGRRERSTNVQGKKPNALLCEYALLQEPSSLLLPSISSTMFLGKLSSTAKASSTPHRWSPITAVVHFLSAFSLYFSFLCPSPLPFSPSSFCCSKCLHSLLPYFCRFPSVIWSTFSVPPALLGAPAMSY